MTSTNRESRWRSSLKSDISIRITSFAAALLAAIVACNGNGGSRPSADGPVDAADGPVDAVDGGVDAADGLVDAKDGGDARVMDVRDGGDGVCRESIDAMQPFGGCRARFDDPGWRSNVCFAPATVTERACDGYRSRQFNLGTHGWTCYYAPVALTLVAGAFQDDVTTFCAWSSSAITFGDVPEAGTCGAPVVLDMPCGPDDAGSQDVPSDSPPSDGG